MSLTAFQLTLDDRPFPTPLGKLVCVGRNYAEHAAELNNPVPDEPLLFMKPATSVVPMAAPIDLSRQQEPVHYETEIALLIGQPLSQASAEEGLAAVAGVGLALDLTLRGLQSKLKAQGHPWERAKAWDGACPLSGFVAAQQVTCWSALRLCMQLNGEVRQHGSASEMLMSIPDLLAHISQTFSLLPGDVVLTGTPAGVGTLSKGDQVYLELNDLLSIRTQAV